MTCELRMSNQWYCVDLHSYLVNVEKNLKKDGGKARLMNLLIQVLGGRLISVV